MRGKKTRERVHDAAGSVPRGDTHVITSRAPMAPPSVHAKAIGPDTDAAARLSI